MHNSKTVVFIADYHEPLRSTVLPICRALLQRQAANPHVILDNPTEQSVHLCQHAGVPFTRRGRVASAGSKGPSKPQRTPRAASWVVNSLINTAKTPRRIAQLRRQLDQLDAAAVVLLDDRTPISCRWAAAARQRKIPSTLVQWAATHRAATMQRLRLAQQSSQHKGWAVRGLEKVAARIVPNAVADVDGEPVWYISSEMALAYRLASAFPQYTPWCYGGGNADVLAVLGKAWKERLVCDGVPADKIVITGHPDQDRWFDVANLPHDELRRDVTSDLGLTADDRLITLIAPALCFRGQRGARQGDVSLSDLQQSFVDVVDAIARLGNPYRAVIKVHPRDQVADYHFLGDHREGAPIVVRDYPTEKLIAASESMCCCWSSAAMIGQAVGTPVLLFDFFESPSAEVWQSVVNLSSAANVREFETNLRYMLFNDRTRREWERQRRKFVEQFLCFDGRATDRLVEMILGYVDQPLNATLEAPPTAAA